MEAIRGKSFVGNGHRDLLPLADNEEGCAPPTGSQHSNSVRKRPSTVSMETTRGGPLHVFLKYWTQRETHFRRHSTVSSS